MVYHKFIIVVNILILYLHVYGVFDKQCSV